MTVFRQHPALKGVIRPEELSILGSHNASRPRVAEIQSPIACRESGDRWENGCKARSETASDIANGTTCRTFQTSGITPLNRAGHSAMCDVEHIEFTTNSIVA